MNYASYTIHSDVELEHRIIEYSAQLMLAWTGDDQDKMSLVEVEALDANIVVYDAVGVELGEYPLEAAPVAEQRLFNAYIDDDLNENLSELSHADFEWRHEEH